MLSEITSYGWKSTSSGVEIDWYTFQPQETLPLHVLVRWGAQPTGAIVTSTRKCVQQYVNVRIDCKNTATSNEATLKL